MSNITSKIEIEEEDLQGNIIRFIIYKEMPSVGKPSRTVAIKAGPLSLCLHAEVFTSLARIIEATE